MINALKNTLNTGLLPGDEAHLEMTPYRNKVANVMNHTKPPVECAVSVLLFNDESTLKCVLIQRPVYNGTHSAQVAFPGGKKENNESLVETALRETYEEVGIKPDDIEVLGQLSTLYIPPSNSLVYPFVGVLKNKPFFKPDEREVAEVFTFNVEDLTALKKIETTQVALSNELKINTPYFNVNNKIVWGATAAMLNELRYVLLKLM